MQDDPKIHEGTISPEDLAVLDRLKKGDEDAFFLLVNQYQRSLQRVALLYTADASVAAEVVQETWVGFLKGLDRFEGRSSVKTWLFKILTNRAKTRGIREKRTVPFSSMAGTDDTEEYEPSVTPESFGAKGHWQASPHAWPEDLPSAVLERKELREVIDQEIARLPEVQRMVVTLKDIEGWDSQEICNVLEISETNQRVLLHRARSRLRSAIERYWES